MIVLDLGKLADEYGVSQTLVDQVVAFYGSDEVEAINETLNELSLLEENML